MRWFYVVHAKGQRPIRAKDEAEVIARETEMGRAPLSIKPLPYGPGICFNVEACAGHTSCPRKYSCSE